MQHCLEAVPRPLVVQPAKLYVQADRDADIDGASWAVMHEISKLAYNVDADQVTRAKNQLKAQILFSQDGPSGMLLTGRAALFSTAYVIDAFCGCCNCGQEGLDHAWHAH